MIAATAPPPLTSPPSTTTCASTHGLAAGCRGGKAVPVWTTNQPTRHPISGVRCDGQFRGPRNPGHVDPHRPWEREGRRRFSLRYDIDPQSDIERTQLLSGRDATSMKDRLCHAQEVVPGLVRGQDSPLCQTGQKPRYERKPITTPPPTTRASQDRPDPGNKTIAPIRTAERVSLLRRVGRQQRRAVSQTSHPDAFHPPSIQPAKEVEQ